MPRVHKVERARKAKPEKGIKVGDTYYWWTFKNQRGPGTKMVSLTYPKPSQLTRSAFKSQWRGFAEEIGDLALDDGLHEALQDIASRIRELGEECQSSLDNMPEGLQQGATGEMLQERINNCETWADEIEGLDEPDRDACNSEAEDEFPEPERSDFDEGEDGDKEFADAVAQAKSDRDEKAEELWQEKLEALKEEAANADPGEV